MSSSTSLSITEHAYLLNLLLGHRSLNHMHEQAFLPNSLSNTYRCFSLDPNPQQHTLARCLPTAPQGAYLVVDGLVVPHEGKTMQGLSPQYSSSKKDTVLGWCFTSSALVSFGHEPYPLRLDPLLSRKLPQPSYSCLTPTEALLTVVGDVQMAGYQLKGVLADAQYGNRLALRSLQALKLGFIARFKRNQKVSYEGETLKLRDLAERFPPGKARYYRKLGLYIKRLKVLLEDVGEVDVLLIWRLEQGQRNLRVLVSTVEAGVQEIVRAYALRWGVEVLHRLLKQNLSLGRCCSRKLSGQLKHADLCFEALRLMWLERKKEPGLSWREAQRRAAAELKDALMTGDSMAAA